MRLVFLYLLVGGSLLKGVGSGRGGNNADRGIGMVVGLIIRLTPGRSIQDSVTFDYQFFFNLLLPPIILASGYELHQVSRGLGGRVIARRIEIVVLISDSGKLLPQHRHDPHLRLPRDVYLRRRSGAYSLAMDPHPHR